MSVACIQPVVEGCISCTSLYRAPLCQCFRKSVHACWFPTDVFHLDFFIFSLFWCSRRSRVPEVERMDRSERLGPHCESIAPSGRGARRMYIVSWMKYASCVCYAKPSVVQVSWTMRVCLFWVEALGCLRVCRSRLPSFALASFRSYLYSSSTPYVCSTIRPGLRATNSKDARDWVGRGFNGGSRPWHVDMSR